MIVAILALDHRCALADDGRGVFTVDGHAQCARRWRAGEFNLEIELGADQDLGPVKGINGLRLRGACDEQQHGADAQRRLWCHGCSPMKNWPMPMAVSLSCYRRLVSPGRIRATMPCSPPCR